MPYRGRNLVRVGHDIGAAECFVGAPFHQQRHKVTHGNLVAETLVGTLHRGDNVLGPAVGVQADQPVLHLSDLTQLIILGVHTGHGNQHIVKHVRPIRDVSRLVHRTVTPLW